MMYVATYIIMRSLFTMFLSAVCVKRVIYTDVCLCSFVAEINSKLVLSFLIPNMIYFPCSLRYFVLVALLPCLLVPLIQISHFHFFPKTHANASIELMYPGSIFFVSFVVFLSTIKEAKKRYPGNEVES